MKRRYYIKMSLWAVAALMVFSIITPVEAKGVSINVNSTPMELPADSKPYISEQGRTMVPLRAISSYFDCNVEWVPEGEYETGNVYITPKGQKGKYEMSYLFYVGVNEYCYCGPNGDVEEEYQPKTFSLDAPPVIINGRTFVPLRVIGEIFGEVQWDQSTRTVNIITGGEVKNPGNDTGETVEPPIYDPAKNGMSKGFQNIGDSFGPNDAITFRTIDLEMSPQTMLDTFAYFPMNQKYVNEEFNYELNYPKHFKAQEGSKEGITLYKTDDGEMKVWGGALDVEFSVYMKEVAPHAKNALLDEYVVYIDVSDVQGIATTKKFISDGKTFMGISYSGTHEFISRSPSVGYFNDWEWAELCCENALHHFADTH